MNYLAYAVIFSVVSAAACAGILTAALVGAVVAARNWRVTLVVACLLLVGYALTTLPVMAVAALPVAVAAMICGALFLAVTLPKPYVPNREAHRIHDEKVLFAAHPADFHVWIGTATGAHCSFCGKPRVREEPVQRIREHPGGITWAICDLRALDRSHPVVLAGPFPHFDMLREALSEYLQTAADPCSVRCSTREAFEELCDPETGLDLLIEALTQEKREEAEALERLDAEVAA